MNFEKLKAIIKTEMVLYSSYLLVILYLFIGPNLNDK